MKNINIKEFIKNEKAQSGGIFTLVIALAVFSFIYIIFGVFMDKVIFLSNDWMDTFPMSQARMDAMDTTILYWKALPIIVIIVLMIWIIKNAIRARTGVVQ